jgi:hypothetical protein
MSDDELHQVAAGPRVAAARPLVDRLLGLAAPGATVSVEITVMTTSDAIPRYRDLAPTNHELHIPAEHLAAYLAALDPLIQDPVRRWPELGVDDGAGGRWLSVHGTEPDAVAAVATLPPVPVNITAEDLSRFDWSLLPTERDHPTGAAVEWRLGWPAVADLGPHYKHAAVCLFVNSDGSWDLEPGEPGYLLYISTETGGARRAEHLATAAGLT